jgi:hypothetical protein
VAEISAYAAISKRFTCVGVSRRLLLILSVGLLFLSLLLKSSELSVEVISYVGTFLYNGPLGLNGHKLSG